MPRNASLLFLVVAAPLGAQASDTSRAPAPLNAITVTATRVERTTFDTPQPVVVFDSTALRKSLAQGFTDLFRDAAGLDASGVGPNQRRPEIRLQRGQRILLLTDGLRLNNARRQQDFGELPALAGIAGTERVEVVRGPSSVLYGTDAIGGVINVLSGRVPRDLESGAIRGELLYRYGSAGEGSTPSGWFAARAGRFGATANLAYRDVGQYHAPRGSFGDIALTEATPVFDSGIRDRSAGVTLGFDFDARSQLLGRLEVYDADQAGFGWIDPAKLGASQPKVQILYPDQRYARYSLGYEAKALSTPFANRAEIKAYAQSNERHLTNLVFVQISPTANVDSRSYNFTDLATVGGRVELAKSVLDRHVLTYGVDAFRDRSDNTDSSRSVTTGFGPTPIVRTSNVPTVPNAIFESVGAFAQLELNPFDKLTTVLGGRVQDVSAETRETPNLTRPLAKGRHRAGVWTANALFRATGNLNLIAAVGRGFRSPNLVERFFEGVVTESNTYLAANPDLDAETSLNVDLGLRYRLGRAYVEAFAFRNDIAGAIRSQPTGDTVSGRAEYRNANVGKLRVDGVELTSGVRLMSGLDASVNATWFDATNVSDPGRPVGDSYSSKIVASLGYEPRSKLFALGYTARHQGEATEVIVGTSPVGTVIPAFTVHSARGSLRLPGRLGIRNRLIVAVDNIGNALYSEFPNASFFRPEPGRNVSLALATAF